MTVVIFNMTIVVVSDAFMQLCRHCCRTMMFVITIARWLLLRLLLLMLLLLLLLDRWHRPIGWQWFVIIIINIIIGVNSRECVDALCVMWDV